MADVEMHRVPLMALDALLLTNNTAAPKYMTVRESTCAEETYLCIKDLEKSTILMCKEQLRICLKDAINSDRLELQELEKEEAAAEEEERKKQLLANRAIKLSVPFAIVLSMILVLVF